MIQSIFESKVFFLPSSYLPVRQIPHDDPGDGEDDDEGGPCEDLVLPALPTVAPDTAGGGDTLRLRAQYGALTLALALAGDTC